VQRRERASLALIIAAGLAFRLILLPADPSLSGDPYR
jgi:hypothetical protein